MFDSTVMREVEEQMKKLSPVSANIFSKLQIDIRANANKAGIFDDSIIDILTLQALKISIQSALGIETLPESLNAKEIH